MKKFLIPLIFLVSACGSGEEPKDKIFVTDGVAIGGYDPVAYFEEAEAKEGNPSTVSTYGGVLYRFSSVKNKDLFDQDPEKYIPAYGGWCAYAIAESSTKMQPDPTMWQIQDDKLLLFYDDWMTSLSGGLKEEWNTNKEEYLEKAEKNWEEVSAR